MKRFAGVLVLVFLSQATVTAQLTRRYTQPVVPSEAALSRLNLKLGWRIYVPTDGLRDGLYRVQVADRQLLVQTLSGAITALDIQDGSTLWRARFGVAYRPSPPVGYNERSLFLVQGTRLFAIDRKTGQLQWEYDLPNAAVAAPAADADQVFIPLGTGTLAAYELPQLPGAKPTKGKGKKAEAATLAAGLTGSPSPAYGSSSQKTPLDSLQPAGSSKEPRLIWEYTTEARLEGSPLLTAESVNLADTDGTIVVLAKENRQVRYQFPTDAPLSAPVGQHGEVAYIASQDYNLYALDLPAGKLLWRFAAGGPLLRRPDVTDDSVFIGVGAIGLYRLDRASGREIWRNTRAERFLAANKKYVYAVDGLGRMLILDGARGRELASLDTRDFIVPISNDWTDRVFLASHDGLIICLHDRDSRAPLAMKTVEKKPVPKSAARPPAEPAEDKMPADKPKAEDNPPDKPKEKAKPKAEENPPDKPKEKAKPKADDKAPDKPKQEDKPKSKDEDKGKPPDKPKDK